MSMISELVDRLRRESKSMGKYGVDYMATLLMQASDTIVMLSEKARADTSQSCFNCDHYEPKGWCNSFEDTVSPNYKCCSEFAEIKPYEYEIKALHKEYQEPYCEVADTPQTDWHFDEQDATWYPYKHEDEPQQKSCATCKHTLGNWDGESDNCGRCCGADRRFYEPKTESQTERSK